MTTTNTIGMFQNGAPVFHPTSQAAQCHPQTPTPKFPPFPPQHAFHQQVYPAPNDAALPRSLEELRELAEHFANVDFQQGPSHNPTMSWTHDMEEMKKRKKKKSAYITRFRQKHYESLLERVVMVSEEEMKNQAKVYKALAGRNASMKEELKMLEKMVAEQMNEQEEEVQEKNTDVAMSSVEQSVSSDAMESCLNSTTSAASNAEEVGMNVIATEEAQDLSSNPWMPTLEPTGVPGSEADAETVTSHESSTLNTMDDDSSGIANDLYVKPTFEDWIMEDAPCFGQDVSNLLAKLTQAA